MARMAALAASLVLGVAAPALAADTVAPVREVMQVTESNWSEVASAPEELFTTDRLERLFSRSFRDLYARAMQDEFAREAGTPFDYDPIVDAQDGCPLENLTITPKPAEDGKAVVVARFQFQSCSGEGPESQAYSETWFEMVDEDGRAVIDDIIVPYEAGGANSTKAVLADIAASQPN